MGSSGKAGGGRGPQGRPPSAGERGLRPLCFGPGPKRPAGPNPSPSASPPKGTPSPLPSLPLRTSLQKTAHPPQTPSARPCCPHPTARRPFRLRRNTQAPPASAAGGGRACGRPSPPVCGAAGSLRSPPLTAPHLCSIIKTESRYLCKMQYFVDDTDTRPSERNGRSYRYNYQNLTQQEEQ